MAFPSRRARSQCPSQGWLWLPVFGDTQITGAPDLNSFPCRVKLPSSSVPVTRAAVSTKSPAAPAGLHFPNSLCAVWVPFVPGGFIESGGSLFSRSPSANGSGGWRAQDPALGSATNPLPGSSERAFYPQHPSALQPARAKSWHFLHSHCVPTPEAAFTLLDLRDSS